MKDDTCLDQVVSSSGKVLLKCLCFEKVSLKGVNNSSNHSKVWHLHQGAPESNFSFSKLEPAQEGKGKQRYFKHHHLTGLAVEKGVLGVVVHGGCCCCWLLATDFFLGVRHFSVGVSLNHCFTGTSKEKVLVMVMLARMFGCCTANE